MYFLSHLLLYSEKEIVQLIKWQNLQKEWIKIVQYDGMGIDLWNKIGETGSVDKPSFILLLIACDMPWIRCL